MKDYLFAGACLAAQIVMPASAQSATSSAYLELGPTVLLTELEGEIDDLLLEDNVSINMITARGGVNVTENLSIEADFSVGTSGENLNESVSLYDVDGAFSGEIKVNYLAGIYAKGHVPLTENNKIRAFARVGYVVSELEASGKITAEVENPPTIVIFDTPYTIPGSYELSGTYTAERDGLVGGGGIEIDFTERLYLRAEATYFALENAPTFGAALALGLKF